MSGTVVRKKSILPTERRQYTGKVLIKKILENLTKIVFVIMISVSDFIIDVEA